MNKTQESIKRTNVTYIWIKLLKQKTMLFSSNHKLLLDEINTQTYVI